MSRAESPPISPRENGHSARKIASYLASLTVVLSGVISIAKGVANSDRYDEFKKENPDVIWAQDQVQDFNEDVDRVLSENNSAGLESLGERIFIVSSALTTLEEHESEIPTDPGTADFIVGSAFILAGAFLAVSTKIGEGL